MDWQPPYRRWSTTAGASVGPPACVEYWARFLDQHGTAMTLAGCAMARFAADGLITEARDYWHLHEGHEPPEWDR